jgi:16S rRNA (guanine(966)-N(2))-methyltransferase RsmD
MNSDTQETKTARVITGSAKSIPIEIPARSRAITDRAKSSLFSMIDPDIPKKKILDLYAGSGSLGIEALSRGAESCTFVDKSEKACKLIEKNLDKTQLSDKASVTCADVTIFLNEMATQAYDIVFADPPFNFYEGREDALTNLLRDIETIVPAGGGIIIKHPSEIQPSKFEQLAIAASREFGASTITIWVKMD